MKKNLLLTVLFVLGIILPIQMQAQEKEKGFFVEGSISFGEDEKSSGRNEHYLMLKPTIGYQFSPKWDAGIKLEFQSGRSEGSTCFGIIPYARYSFCELGKVRLFGEAKASRYNKKYSWMGEDNDYIEAGLSLGAYFPLNKHFKFVCQYLHIGYSERFKEEGASIHSGNWGIDTDFKRLSLGINFIF